MPSYEYECQNCHTQVEVVQAIENHQPPSTCPVCSMQHTMVRVFNLQGEASEDETKKVNKE